METVVEIIEEIMDETFDNLIKKGFSIILDFILVNKISIFVGFIVYFYIEYAISEIKAEIFEIQENLLIEFNRFENRVCSRLDVISQKIKGEKPFVNLITKMELEREEIEESEATEESESTEEDESEATEEDESEATEEDESEATEESESTKDDDFYQSDTESET
jgi:hypothetical protein